MIVLRVPASVRQTVMSTDDTILSGGGGLRGRAALTPEPSPEKKTMQSNATTPRGDATPSSTLERVLSEYQAARSVSRPVVFLEVVGRYADLALNDLASVAVAEGLGNLRVGDIVGGAERLLAEPDEGASLTTAELSRASGVGRSTLYRWAALGLLPRRRLQGGWPFEAVERAREIRSAGRLPVMLAARANLRGHTS